LFRGVFAGFLNCEEDMAGTRKKRLPQHHAAAYREAGHAVSAWHRGVMLMPISIFTRGKRVGKNVWHDPLRNVDMEWVRLSPSAKLAERLGAILIAGPAAESALGPSVRRGSASIGRIEDAKALLVGRPSSRQPRARSGGVQAARTPRGGRYTRVEADVVKFLARDDVRKAVEALAAALLARGTIRGEEAASIIESFIDEPLAE
jgi:hypothetical protein